MKHPNLVWEGRRADGRVVSCLVLPAWPKHGVVWYVDDVIEGVEEFKELEAAHHRAQELQAQYCVTHRERVGRRLLPRGEGAAGRDRGQ